MAYSRYRRKTRTRRNYRPKPVSKARYLRELYRGTKRRSTRRRPMSKRRILNTTSRKKRNGMLSWSNTNSSATSQPVTTGGLYVNTAGAYVVWNATAQQLDAQSLVINQSSRTATTCYMKGLADHVKIQTSSGIPWFHRRICFTHRGPSPFNISNTETAMVQPYQPFTDTSNGIERLWFNQLVNAQPNTVAAQYAILFKGVVGKDWNDTITAPVDTSRVNLKFDKTWTIQSGNSNGVVKERKLWHAMNKNLVYNDDENGDTELTDYYSVASKAGMGDYYVVDIIQPGTGATSSDYLTMLANSTLYWHEK